MINIRTGRLARILVSYIALGQVVQAVTPPPDGGYSGSNTAEGENALLSLTDGTEHTAAGFNALYNQTDSYDITAVGALALSTTNNYFSQSDTAVGFQTMLNAQSEGADVAIGYNALLGAKDWFGNVAMGANALSIQDSAGSVAIGSGALQNSNGGNNWAFGAKALGASTGGGFNVAVGRSALFGCTGLFNMALGAYALSNLTDDSGNNIAIGYSAGRRLLANADYNIIIGNRGSAGDTNTIRIGEPLRHKTTYIAGVKGVTVARGGAVLVSSDGQLGTRPSSLRYKEEVKLIKGESAVIAALKPVSFRYKKKFDPKRVAQFGLVAEQVREVAPELVAYDRAGKPEAVRYQEVNAMLLNEFIKQHGVGEQQDCAIHREEQDLQELAAKTSRLQADLESNALELDHFTEQSN